MPLVILNDTLVLTNDGAIMNLSLFNKDILQNLMRITMHKHALENTKLSFAQDLLAFVTQLPDSIRSHYTISWQDRTAITLYKKTTKPTYHILCDAATKFSNKLLQSLKNIETVIQQRALKKKSIAWQTDIRFNSFIVLSSTLGEKL
jgi:hypothetical protein